jgi:hypothetical protein
MIAAGVVSAASVVSMPAHRGVPTVQADVAYTSAVTDALAGFGQLTEVGNSLIGIHVDAVISLPFEATLALMAAQQHPELSSSVLSFLVQRFVNPSVGDPIHAYPYDTELTVSRLAELLPYPLGPSATEPGLINEGGVAFAAVFNSVLSQLGDPIPGYEAVQSVMHDTALGGAVVAAHLLTRAPMNMAWNTANYLGYLPANVEAAFESAIAEPDKIPGLISYLAYGLLSPDPSVGLFGKLLNNVVDPFTWLPAPIGNPAGVASMTHDVIASVMNGVLSVLPAPVTPSALPPGTGPVLGPRGGLSAAKDDETSPQATTLAVSEPVQTEPVKTDVVATDTVNAETVTAKPATAVSEKVETKKDDAESVQPAKTETDSAKKDSVESAEPAKSESTKVASKKSEPKKAESTKAESTKSEPKKSESTKAEPKKSEPTNSESNSSRTGDASHGTKSGSSGDAA